MEKLRSQKWVQGPGPELRPPSPSLCSSPTHSGIHPPIPAITILLWWSTSCVPHTVLSTLQGRSRLNLTTPWSIPFDRWGEWGSERLRNLPKVTQLAFKARCLIMMLYCLAKKRMYYLFLMVKVMCDNLKKQIINKIYAPHSYVTGKQNM